MVMKMMSDLLGFKTHRINGKEINISGILKDKVLSILKKVPKKELRNIDSIDICSSKKNANLFLSMFSVHNLKRGLLGSYSPETKSIFVYKNPKSNWIETLLHEIGHAIYRNTKFGNSEVMAEKYANRMFKLMPEVSSHSSTH